MKKSLLFLTISLTLLFNISCEKVIDYELDSSEARYVIEGEITNQAGGCVVKISKSVNFSDDNTFPAIENAHVIISDNLGNIDTLTETSQGIYTLDELVGIEGRTYSLTVNIDSEEFTATSTMPAIVPFEGINFMEISDRKGTVDVPVPNYTDPEETENYYRFIEYIDGEKVETIFVRNDDHNNGLSVDEPILNFEDGNEIDKGDYYRIIMMCIDEYVYKYFYSLSLISDGGDTGTPANPTSNITGGTPDALGYFSAHTVQEKTATTP